MRNRLIPVLAAAAALGVPALFAAPASASNGPPPAVCTSGSSCIVELNYQVTYTGSSGGNNGVVIPPPPCIGVPAGDAHTGSQAIISLYSDTAPVPSPSTAPPSPPSSSPSQGTGTTTSSPSPSSPSPSATSPSPSPSATTSSPPPPDTLPPAEQQILSQARQLVKTNPIAPGEWYQITGDPYATALAQQRCNTLPPYVWAPGAGTLRIQGLRIPERVLAALAYNQLTTATLGAVALNPRGTSDTNLPTFIDVALQRPRLGVLSVTPAGVPYVWATAATPNGQAATVWAKVTGLNIAAGTPDATTWQAARCGVAHLSRDGHQFILGSRYSKAAMAQAGAGAPIDCGVTYTAPGAYDLTVNVGWYACWTPGLATAAGPPPGNACKPVPGAVGGLQDSTTGPVPIHVREIQSVNG